MAAREYIGVAGVARKVKEQWFGVSGVARRVFNGYIGIGGVARKIFNAARWTFETGSGSVTTATELSAEKTAGELVMHVACSNSSSTNNGGYAQCSLWYDDFPAGETLTLEWSDSSSTSYNYNDKKLMCFGPTGGPLNDPDTYGSVLSTSGSGSFSIAIPQGTVRISIRLAAGARGSQDLTWRVTKFQIGNKSYL